MAKVMRKLGGESRAPDIGVALVGSWILRGLPIHCDWSGAERREGGGGGGGTLCGSASCVCMGERSPWLESGGGGWGLEAGKASKMLERTESFMGGGEW